MRKTYMHWDGCAGPAFHYDGPLNSNAPLFYECVYHLDGTQGQANDPLICETCGDPLVNFTLEWFE